MLWPLTAGLAFTGFLAYRFAPDTSSITDYLSYYFPDRNVWTQRNDAYLEKVVLLSEDRRLMEDAEAPKLRRRRFPQSVAPNLFLLLLCCDSMFLPSHTSTE